MHIGFALTTMVYRACVGIMVVRDEAYARWVLIFTGTYGDVIQIENLN